MANEFMRGVTVVSTHSRLKAAGPEFQSTERLDESFNTQPPEGGWNHGKHAERKPPVSTHSRLKAAGAALMQG